MSDIPVDGSVYSFRTAPLSEFAPQKTDRFGALKILGSNGVYIAIAVLDCIWMRQPSLEDVCECAILRQYRFFHTGRRAVFGINPGWWTLSDLEQMTLLGTIMVKSEELQLASNIFNRVPGSTYSTLCGVNSAAEGEWRWNNDRATLVAEQERVDAREAAKRAAREEPQRNRLRGLTWEQLLSETPFDQLGLTRSGHAGHSCLRKSGYHNCWCLVRGPNMPIARATAAQQAAM